MHDELQIDGALGRFSITAASCSLPYSEWQRDASEVVLVMPEPALRCHVFRGSDVVMCVLREPMEGIDSADKSKVWLEQLRLAREQAVSVLSSDTHLTV